MALEFLEGNEALVRGAIAANCRFFAGYPITPASSIFQHMLTHMPEAGGIAIPTGSKKIWTICSTA